MYISWKIFVSTDCGLKKAFGCPECDYKMFTFFIYNAKSEESDKNRPHVVSNKSKPKSFFRLYHDKYVNVQSVITIFPQMFYHIPCYNWRIGQNKPYQGGNII